MTKRGREILEYLFNLDFNAETPTQEELIDYPT